MPVGTIGIFGTIACARPQHATSTFGHNGATARKMLQTFRDYRPGQSDCNTTIPTRDFHSYLNVLAFLNVAATVMKIDSRAPGNP
eukprot:553215-Amphidinium_carterae.1